jgi:hypothetical protein
MHIDPFETDFLARSHVIELAIVDERYNIICFRIFGKMAYLYGSTLLLTEQNDDILVAHEPES